MSKIRILIADRDKDYNKSLADYLMYHFPQSIEVDSCSDEALLNEYIKGQEIKIDILLLNENFKPVCEKIPEEIMVITLIEEKKIFSENRKSICKYQCGDEIINQVLSLCAGKSLCGSLVYRDSKRSRVVAVYSSAGGVGKTTLAIGLSIQTAWEGKNIFYLNLENIPSTELYLGGEQESSLSNVLYYLKHNKKDNIFTKIEAAKCIDPVYRISYFKRPDSLQDIKENLAEELGLLIEQLASGGQYERVFIDMSSCFDGNTISVLEICDDILLVYTPDAISKVKTGMLFEELTKLEKSKNISLLDKVSLVLNMCEENKSAEEFAISCFGKSSNISIPKYPGLLVPYLDRFKPDLDGAFGTTLYKLSRTLDIR